MKLYSSTEYSIVNGVSLNEDIIFDKRINESIIVEEPYDINVIKRMFEFSSILELLNSNIDKENIKLNMKLLYDLDVIQLKSMYSKKIFYNENIIKMYTLSILSYLLRYIPLYLFLVMNTLLVNRSPSNSIITLTLVITTIVSHELIHSFMYTYFKNFKAEFYIVIDKFSIYIVTKILTCSHRRLVALSGPVMGGILALMYYIITRNIIYVIISIYHFAMLLPFFEDGKHFWNQEQV